MAKRKPTRTSKPTLLTDTPAGEFDAVVAMIRAARTRAMAAVNTTLIDLSWQTGEHLSGKIAANEWGDGTIEQLARHIHKHQPGAAGFSARNLWRMRQFFETYSTSPKLSPLVRQLSWTHNLMILSRSKRDDEREFYLRMATREQWSSRELERQLNDDLCRRLVETDQQILGEPMTRHDQARFRKRLEEQSQHCWS